jgi:hypothetical protein
MLTKEELHEIAQKKTNDGILSFIIDISLDKVNEYVDMMKNHNWIECPYVKRSPNGRIHFQKVFSNNVINCTCFTKYSDEKIQKIEKIEKKLPKIIAVTGIAGAGKDTFAETIKSSEPDTDIFAFAGPLKEACKILFNLSDDQLYNPVMKEEIDPRWGKSPREMFQIIGDSAREVNIDCFIMNMKQRIDNSKAKYNVISDVRYDNEAEFIRSLDGKVIKIIRDNDKNNGKTTEHSGHKSEKGISEHLINAIIENNATIEEFQNNVQVASKFIFKKIGEANHSNHFTIDDDTE